MLALKPGRTVVGRPSGGRALGRRARRRARRRWSSSTCRTCDACSGRTAFEIVTHGRGYELQLADGDVDARAAPSGCSTSAGRATRWRCGAASRWPTSPTSRSRPPRSAASRSCACAPPRSAIDADLEAGRHAEVIGELDALAAETRCASTSTPSGCSRSTAAAVSRRRSRPTATRARSLVEEIGVEPGAELRRLHERSSLRIRRSTCPRRPTPSRRPRAGRRRAARHLLIGAAVLLIAGVTAFGVIRVIEPEGLEGIDENSVGLIDPAAAASPCRSPSARARSPSIARRRIGVDRQRRRGHRLAHRPQARKRGVDLPSAAARRRSRTAAARCGSPTATRAGWPRSTRARTGRARVRRRQRAALARVRRRRRVGRVGRRRADPRHRSRARPRNASRSPWARTRRRSPPAPARCGSRARRRDGDADRPADPQRACRRSRRQRSERDRGRRGRGVGGQPPRRHALAHRPRHERGVVVRWCRAATRRRSRSGRARCGWQAGGRHRRAGRSRRAAQGAAVRDREPPGGDRGRRAAVWAAADAPQTSHRGGTLRVRLPYAPEAGIALDPLHPWRTPRSWAPSSTRCSTTGWSRYRRVPGAAGHTLVGALATTAPPPGDFGKTYIFTLRRGLRYSDGRPVRPTDFKASMERFLEVTRDCLRRRSSPPFYAGIVGARACMRSRAPCDLSRGIEADAPARTIAIHLTCPDGDLLHKLTMQFAYVMPPAALAARRPARRHPGTGPYRVVDWDAHRGGTLDAQRLLPVQPGASRAEGFADRIEVVAHEARHDRTPDRRRTARLRGSRGPRGPLRHPGPRRRFRAIVARCAGYRCRAVRQRPRTGSSSTRGSGRSTTSACGRRSISRSTVPRSSSSREDRRPARSPARSCRAASPGTRRTARTPARRRRTAAGLPPTSTRARGLVAASGRAGEHVIVRVPDFREAVGRYYARVLRELGFRTTVRVQAFTTARSTRHACADRASSDRAPTTSRRRRSSATGSPVPPGASTTSPGSATASCSGDRSRERHAARGRRRRLGRRRPPRQPTSPPSCR